MKKREAAIDFTRRVDLMLGRIGKTAPPIVTPLTCGGDMELARKLAETDFTVFSDSFATLAGTVTSNAAIARLRRRVSPAARAGDLLALRLLRPLSILVGALALAAVLIQCTYPGGLTGLNAEVQKAFATVLRVGPATMVETVKDRDALEKSVAAIPDRIRNQVWFEGTPSGTLAGNVLEGESNQVLRFTSYQDAKSSIKFAFVAPRVIPQGYALKDVFVYSLGRHVLFVYSSTDGEITISEVSVSASYAFGFVTDSPFVDVVANGTQAAWNAANGVLLWEAENISYAVAGRHLKLDDALRIKGGLE